MTQDLNHSTTAVHLLAQRNSSQPRSDMPMELRPQSVEDSLEIQKLMIELFMIKHQAQPITGWKCLTPRDNGDVIVAPILSPRISHQPECPIIAVNDKALIEPEIGFILQQDLVAHRHYSNDEIDAAIGATHMALELIQSRFSADYQASYFDKLADGLSNQGLYIGPEINKTLAYQAAKIVIKVTQDDATTDCQGQHPCELPQNPLYWVVNYLTQKGISLLAGQAIITGSYFGVIKAEMGLPTQIEYVGLGQFEVSFTAA